MRITHRWLSLAALACSSAAGADSAALQPAFFEALRAADLRVATVGYRLAVGNAALCRERQAELGIVLQALDQFDGANRAAADRAFRFGSGVIVEAVVPGGPAARAGVQAGDSLVAVAGRALPPKPGGAGAATSGTRDAAEQIVADQPLGRPVNLTLRRGGRDLTLDPMPETGCRVAFELLLDNGWTADSDGRRIRIGSRFLERYDDQGVAVVVGHELGHVVLEHRRRLDAAHVGRGLFKEVGRNGRLFRRVEDEADALGTVLLYNAGFDPMAASRFWKAGGPGVAGLFRAAYYRSNGDRSKLTAAAAAAIPAGAARPYTPPLLATRDRPLT